MMRTRAFIALLGIISLIFVSCDESNTDIGSSVMPSGDAISVGADTFRIQTENFIAPYMISNQDSFLLGTFYEETFGTTHADVLAQVKHPNNFKYKAGTIADSAVLVLFYSKFAGDKYSPMHISVYEMNKKTFSFFDALKSNINPDEYCDKSIFLGSKTTTPVDANKKNDSTKVTIKLDDAFCQRFFNGGNTTNIYSSDEAFRNFFKGLYITTDFGSASMLYITQIDLKLHHHYTYKADGVINKDSTYKVNNVIYFRANDEVRQANRFLHPDIITVKNKLESTSKDINFVSSPANLYTKVKLPLKSIFQKISPNKKRLSINRAQIRVDIASIDEEDLSLPLVSKMMLIKESKVDSFFIKKELPNDKYAVLGTYAYGRNADTNELEYYYTFDIDDLLADEFKNAGNNITSIPDIGSYLLMPVRVTTDASSNITAVGPQFLLSGVKICSGTHAKKPMKASVVYSNF